MVDTLTGALEATAGITHKGYTFLDGDLNPTEWSFADLVKEARRRGAKLRAMGLEKGDRLAMIIPEPEDFVLSFLGAITAGIVPVPMYPPLALGRLDSYIDGAASILKAAGAKMLLTTKQVAPVLWTLVGKVETLHDLILCDKLREPGAAELPPVEITPDDTCFLQFTSGSTAAPKGVIVTHRNLAANARAIMFDGLESDGSIDKGVSWLPLYHDMGLIGFVIAPLFAEVPVVFIPTISFVKRPNVWMETVHKYRGTITFGPNFAFGLAAKRAARSKGSELELSCLRVIGCGAEPINSKTMRNFLEAFEPMGVKARALMPCYGMAEATLAMSFDRLTRPMRAIEIDRETYEEKNQVQLLESGVAPKDGKQVLELVSCGKTFPGHELGIMDDHGELLSEGHVGEIVFRGPSVTPGYFRNAEATQTLLAGGWLHTGDLGFQVDGEVFISGRKKDLIILNGRNYYPQAIEWVVEQTDGIRKGNVVAFSVNGDTTEKLVVVAESTATDRQPVIDAVSAHIKGQLGLAVGEVVLVPRGAIPKTSSGKLQRRKTKSHYEDGSIHHLGDRTLGSTAAKVTLFRHMTVSVFARIRHNIRRAIPMGIPRGLLGRAMFLGASRREKTDHPEKNT
jgi:fatty-acyl-CoA synthase